MPYEELALPLAMALAASSAPPTGAARVFRRFPKLTLQPLILEPSEV